MTALRLPRHDHEPPRHSRVAEVYSNFELSYYEPPLDMLLNQ